MRLHDEPIKDVSEDVMVLCSTEELREAREKLFAFAKMKVHGDSDGGEGAAPIIAGMKSITDPWGLIARRSKKRLDEDVCQLYLFVVTDGYKFPYKILKRGTMKDCGKQRDIRSVLRSVPRELPARDGIDNTDLDEVITTATCEKQPLMPIEDTHVPAMPTVHNAKTSAAIEQTIPDTAVRTTKIQMCMNVPEPESSRYTLPHACHDDSLSDESEATDPQRVESEGACESPGHVVVLPTIKITPPTCDIGLQCSLIDAPALILIPKKDSPGQKLRFIVDEMARNHEESWDDLIEAEQIVNPQYVPDDDEEDEHPQQPLGNAIQDQVGRDEFEGHVEFQDRALSEHENRISALESTTQQFDHRVDVVDAVLNEKMRLLRIRQEDSDDEMLKVRHFITTFLEQASMHRNSQRKPSANGPVNASTANVPSAPTPGEMTKPRGSTSDGKLYAMPQPLEQRERQPAANKPRKRPDGDKRRDDPPLHHAPPKLTPGIVYSTPRPPRNGDNLVMPRNEEGGGKTGPSDSNKGKVASGGNQADTDSIEPVATSSRAEVSREAQPYRAPPNQVGTGARPKTKAQGNDNSDYNDYEAQQPSGSHGGGSYADAASKYPWQTPEKKKRKRDPSGQSQTKKPMLKGVSNKGNRELSVLGLSNDGFKDLVDIEDAVRAHCKERNVDLVFIKVFRKKHELNTVGCKIAVKAPDAYKVTGYDFWPEDVHARKWHRGNKGANGDEEKATTPKRD